MYGILQSHVILSQIVIRPSDKFFHWYELQNMPTAMQTAVHVNNIQRLSEHSAPPLKNWLVNAV
jgi:hypothetical protein